MQWFISLPLFSQCDPSQPSNQLANRPASHLFIWLAYYHCWDCCCSFKISTHTHTPNEQTKRAKKKPTTWSERNMLSFWCGWRWRSNIVAGFFLMNILSSRLEPLFTMCIIYVPVGKKVDSITLVRIVYYEFDGYGCLSVYVFFGSIFDDKN